MVEIESKDIGVKLPDRATISFVAKDELRNELEGRDSRLSVVESTVREVKNSMHLWSNIIQDGLADLNMHVRVMQGRHVKRMHAESESEDDSNISERLSKVEQQMQRMQTRVQEDLEVGARIVKFEKHVRALQVNIEEIQDKCFQVLQGSLDELNGHDNNIVAQKGGTCERSLSPSLLLHPQRVHPSPQPQLQVQHQSKSYSACLPQGPEVTNNFQPHSGVTEKKTRMLSRTRVVEGMVSPKQLQPSRRVASPHASNVLQASFTQASTPMSPCVPLDAKAANLPMSWARPQQLQQPLQWTSCRK